MVNKSAKALIFFGVALIAFLCSAVFAVQTYNMLADAEMEKSYSNPDNITVEDAKNQDSRESSNNNHYYPNNSSLSDKNSSNNNEGSFFNINIFNLFNSTNGNDKFDAHSFLDELKDKLNNIFGNR